jgi:hypothetical protein
LAEIASRSRLHEPVRARTPSPAWITVSRTSRWLAPPASSIPSARPARIVLSATSPPGCSTTPVPQESPGFSTSTSSAIPGPIRSPTAVSGADSVAIWIVSPDTVGALLLPATVSAG